MSGELDYIPRKVSTASYADEAVVVLGIFDY